MTRERAIAILNELSLAASNKFTELDAATEYGYIDGKLTKLTFSSEIEELKERVDAFQMAIDALEFAENQITLLKLTIKEAGEKP